MTTPVNWGTLDNPMAGFNTGMATLADAIQYRQKLARQEMLDLRQKEQDKIAAKTHGLQQTASQMAIDKAKAEEAGLMEATKTTTSSAAFAATKTREIAQKEAEAERKTINDILDAAPKLINAGTNPQTVTDMVNGIIGKTKMKDAFPKLQFSGKDFVTEHDFPEGKIPDRMNPGKFMPAGRYEVTARPMPNGQDPKIVSYKLKDPKTVQHDTVIKKTNGGKTEQRFMYNPKSTAKDPYDIPIGEPSPVSSQVPSVNVQMGQATQDEIDTMADLLGRGKIDPADIPKRGGTKQVAQIYKRAEELHPGFDPRGTKAENTAYQATLQQQEKQRGAVGSFVKNIDSQIDTVKEIFDYLQRTDARAINLPVRELKTRLIGSGLENKYEMFITEISAESSKLSQSAAQSIAQLPEGSRQKWEKIHDLNLPIPEMKFLLEGTKQMGAIRMKSLDDEITDTKKRRSKARGGENEAPASSGVIPRKPGESIADYMKRTSK